MLAYGWRKTIKYFIIGIMMAVGCALHAEQIKSPFALEMLCIGSMLLGYWTLKCEPDRYVNTAALILAVLLAAFMTVGQEVYTKGTVEGIIDADNLVRTFVEWAGISVTFWAMLRLLFCKAKTTALDQADFTCKVSSRRFLLIWLGIICCYLPYWIAFFPGCLSTDSIREVEILLGLRTLSNHHPIIHQWTISPFILIGKALGSLTMGVGLYSLFQMLFMSAVFAAIVMYLKAKGASAPIQGIIFVFYALCSVHAFYSITMWKDVLFGGITAVLMMLLISIAEDETKDSIKKWIGLILVLFLFCTYRNNGYYAFLFAFPLFIIANRKKWKQILAVGLTVIVIVNAYQFLIFDVLKAEKSESGEMLSVPLQQIARAAKNHGRSFTPEEKACIEEIFPSMEELKNAYYQHVSDGVKIIFRSDVFDQDPARYLSLWMKIGIKHPVVYLDAFLNQCFGYWYPESHYWSITEKIQSNRLGLKQTDSDFRSLLCKAHFAQEKMPIIKRQYRPSSYVWLALIACGILMAKRRYRLLSPMLFLLGLWLTTLLSPVYAEFRYVYGIVTAAPLYIGYALCVPTYKENKNTCQVNHS